MWKPSAEGKHWRAKWLGSPRHGQDLNCHTRDQKPLCVLAARVFIILQPWPWREGATRGHLVLGLGLRSAWVPESSETQRLPVRVNFIKQYYQPRASEASQGPRQKSHSSKGHREILASAEGILIMNKRHLSPATTSFQATGP